MSRHAPSQAVRPNVTDIAHRPSAHRPGAVRPARRGGPTTLFRRLRDLDTAASHSTATSERDTDENAQPPAENAQLPR